MKIKKISSSAQRKAEKIVLENLSFKKMAEGKSIL